MSVILIMAIPVAILVFTWMVWWGIMESGGKNAPTTLHTSPLPMEIGAVPSNPLEDIRDVSSCRRCQAPLRPTDRFCSQCGHQYREKTFLPLATNQSVSRTLEGKVCLYCHTFLLPQDQFCGVCGNQTQTDTETTYT